MNRPVVSASKLARRALCPGSAWQESGLPEKETPQSHEGKLLHSFAANGTLDRSFLKPKQRDLLELSAKLDEAILARAREQFGDLGIGLIETEISGQIEMSVHREGKLLVPGHCDWRVHFREKKISIVIDRKFGYLETTPADANKQLRCYAVAESERNECAHVLVAITQPRLAYEQRITMAAYDKEDIEKAREEIIAIVEATKNPDAPLVAGEEQCRYCRAKLICPAFRDLMSSGYEIVPVEQGITKEHRISVASKILAHCTDEQLDRVIQFVRFADFVKEFALDEARDRKAKGGMPNYLLGKPSEIRDIASAGRALSLLQLAGLLTKDEGLDCCEISIGRLEDKIRNKHKWTWDKAEETINRSLSEVIQRKQKKPSLVRKA